jgi:hypothetical protein
MRAEIHEQFHKDEAPEGGSNRNFGIVFGVFFAILAILNYWHGRTAWPWWLGGSLVFLGLSWLLPSCLRPLNAVWTRFGLVLSRITQPIVMALIFFSSIVPAGLIARSLGKDLLRLRLDKSSPTYWIKRTPPGPASDSFKNQF